MKVCICGEDEIINKQIKEIITDNYLDLNITCLQSMDDIKKKNSFLDILIIDVEFYVENDKEIIRFVEKKNKRCKFIFYGDFSINIEKIFETSPAYFLLKPMNQIKITAAMNKAIEMIEKDIKDEIILEYNHKIEKIKTDDILYVESDKRVLYIYGSFGQRTIYQKLDDFENKVKGFIRCNKSYLVNSQHISIFSKEGIILKNNKKKPVSYKRYKEAKKQFLYLLNNNNEYQ